MKSSDPTFWLIMSLTMLLVLCGLLIACNPSNAARGCLDRAQAQRTWPTKQLGVDDDGCFTYMRSGVKPAPELTVPVDTAATAAAEAAVALDLMQRWPTVIEFEMKPEFVLPEEPLVTPRNMMTAILSVVLFCAVLEVLFGGWIWRPR